MKRLLLIEDSPTQREELRLLLEMAGFFVDVAPDGELGLGRMADLMPDLVIADVVMPGLSGYELCRRAKARDRLKDIPIILLTMLDDPGEILRALECGADGFMKKSDGAEDLANRARNLLESRALRAGADDAEGIAVVSLGREVRVTSSREQVLDLLMSTFEDSVRANRALAESLQRLAAQNEALRRAESIKKDMSALLVHDLKGPAAGLMMLARSMLRRAATDGEKRSWATVLETSEMFQRMALNLLDIDRSEDGTLVPILDSLDLVSLAEEVILLLGPFLVAREQTVELERADVDSVVAADSDLLRRVLANLLENAIRHAPLGARLCVAFGAPEASHLEIRVRNPGERIPVEFRERIFQKYARLNPESRSQMGMGRGLGLTFCRIAVEAHGGTIEVEDHPTDIVFLIRLPRGQL